MNKLNCDCLMVIMQEFYCTNTRDYTNIPSCSEKLVFDSCRPQEGIFVYKLVKLYNKANTKDVNTFMDAICNTIIRNAYHAANFYFGATCVREKETDFTTCSTENLMHFKTTINKRK